MKLHHSQTVRLIFASFGIVFVILGVFGIFLPLLPTTPFMLLAAACFARSSERFYHAIKNHRSIGPIVTEWEEHRSMPRKIKKRVMVLVVVTFAITTLFFAQDTWLRVVLIITALALLVFLHRIPSRDQLSVRVDA